MYTKPPLRLTRMLRDATSGSMTIHKLAQEIERANRAADTGCRVNWHTLRNLRDFPEQVGLTWNMLVALHTYFKKHGGSLQHFPILETRGVLEMFTDSHQLVFMLGAKRRPEEKRTDISLWDSQSYADLRAQVSMQGFERKTEIQHVLWRSPVNPAALGEEPWHKILDEDRASVISIGSPLAALSSEIMLARMFGVKPFERSTVTAGQRVPFSFVWLEKLAHDFKSAFGLTSRELASIKPDLAGRVERSLSTAFFLEGEAHEVKVDAHDWTSYGVIAAQRRAAGNIWLVISGLAGPATSAAASLVKDITAELEWPAQGVSKVLWVPVKVQIHAGKPNPTDGDIRRVEGASFEGDFRSWTASH